MTAFREGSWVASPQFGGGPPLGKVLGRTIGIPCYGRIGREVAERDAGLKCRVLAANRSPVVDPTPAETVFPLVELDRMLLSATPPSCRAGWRRGRKVRWQYPTPPRPSRRRPFHEPPDELITPHSSSSTEPTADRHWSAVAANLDQFARGENLENVVLRT